MAQRCGRPRALACAHGPRRVRNGERAKRRGREIVPFPRKVVRFPRAGGGERCRNRQQQQSGERRVQRHAAT
eukprot:78853-Pleurochrysis_carterae.AAC.1